MKTKLIIRIITGSFLLPGFLVDVLIGFGFVLNDGQTTGAGDVFGTYVFSHMLPSCPSILRPIIGLSMWICAIPAGIFVVAFGLFILIVVAYVLISIVTMLIAAPFTGKFEWGIFWKD